MSDILKKSNGSNAWSRAILHHLKEFECRFQLHKGLSTDLSKHFSSDSVDCVFIDGDHTYEGVARDIISYVPILKPGGLLMFDDYGAEDFPGVKRAVKEFSEKNNLTIVTVNGQGNVMVIKPVNKALDVTFNTTVI
jgi:predicted O-methyltransferase YrrM